MYSLECVILILICSPSLALEQVDRCLSHVIQQLHSTFTQSAVVLCVYRDIWISLSFSLSFNYIIWFHRVQKVTSSGHPYTRSSALNSKAITLQFNDVVVVCTSCSSSWVVAVMVGSICFNYLLSPYSFFRVLVDPYSLPRTCFETTVLELNVDPVTGSISLVTLKKEGTGGGVRVNVCVYAFKKLSKPCMYSRLSAGSSRYMAQQGSASLKPIPSYDTIRTSRIGPVHMCTHTGAWNLSSRHAIFRHHMWLCSLCYVALPTTYITSLNHTNMHYGLLVFQGL